MTETIASILRNGVATHATIARVRRYVEDKPVCPRPEDFYAALQYDDRVVVRLSAPLPDDSEVAIDCRLRDDRVEYTHDYRDCGGADRDAFLHDVRTTDTVEVIHHRDSQFAATWTCPDCGEEATDPDSRYLDGPDEVRVKCPDCGAVEYVPQGSEPPADREFGGEEGVA